MGNVAELIGHLISLRVEQRTGILVVRGKDVSSSISLTAGEIVFADEDAHPETLGALLLRQKKLSQSQHDLLLGKLTEPGSIASQLRLGELAAELGFITAADVVKALNDQVRFRIMRVLQRQDELTWQFRPYMESEMVFAPGTPGAALRSAVGVTPPSVEELVLDAVRWIDDDHKNELGLFVALGKKLGVSAEDRLGVVRRFALTREETELLTKLDGKRTLGEILSMSGGVDGPALLTALLLTSVLGPMDGKPVRRASLGSQQQQPAAAVAPTPRPSATTAAAAPARPSGNQMAAAPARPSGNQMAAAPARTATPSAAPTPMQVPAVMRPSAAATPAVSTAVTRPVPAPATSANTRTTTPPKATLASTPVPREDDDGPGPQSVRSGWWGGRGSGTQPAATPTPKPPAMSTTPTPNPSPARPSSPTPGSRPPIPPPPKPSRTFPAVGNSASRLPTAPPAGPASAGRIPTAPDSNPAPASQRIPAAPPSNPSPQQSASAGRIPTAPPSNPSPNARASAVMKALEAKRTTGSRPNMPAVAPHELKMVAEKEFQAALLHFKAFRYADAAPGFTRAAELVPQASEYKLYARWNHILQKGAPMQVHDRGEAWRLALAAIAADPNSAFAHYVAGAVAQEDGQKPIAHRYLSRAVALDPQLVDAQRRLRIVDRREA